MDHRPKCKCQTIKLPGKKITGGNLYNFGAGRYFEI